MSKSVLRFVTQSRIKHMGSTPISCDGFVSPFPLFHIGRLSAVTHTRFGTCGREKEEGAKCHPTTPIVPSSPSLHPHPLPPLACGCRVTEWPGGNVGKEWLLPPDTQKIMKDVFDVQ